MTGVQAAQLGLVAQVEAWREHLGPREYAVLIDLVGRWFDEERRRIQFAFRRWVS
jgi:hypothetical protein